MVEDCYKESYKIKKKVIRNSMKKVGITADTMMSFITTSITMITIILMTS